MSENWSPPSAGQPDAGFERRGAIGEAVARMVAVFAVVGLGLGGGTLIFLSATGFFDPVQGLDDFGRAILGGFAVSAVLVFALLIGVVMAALAGLYLSGVVDSRGRAAAAGGVAAALGHIALVVCVGAVLLAGIELLSDSVEQPPASTSGSSAAPSSFGDAQCEETFGEGSQLCDAAASVPSLPDVPSSSDESSDVVTTENLVKIGLGVVPAAFVGAIVAALLFGRRRSA
jgi:hypothetical protein